MSVDERSRHKLHARLENVLGPEEAAILMEHLPPVGWGDVATKHDLDQLSFATKRDLDQLRAEFKQDLQSTEYKLTAAFRGELLHQTRTFILTTWTAVMTAVLTVGGLAFAAARLV